MAHAPMAPSALERMAACPGSYKLILTIPKEERDVSTPAAERGTMLHALLADRAALALGRPLTAIAEGYSEGGLTPADRAALNKAWSAIQHHPAFLQQTGHAAWSEQEVEVGRWCGLPLGLLWGTADLILVTPDTLEIVDAKFGNRVVMPDSLQLKAYAVGAGALLIQEDQQFRPEFRAVRNVKLSILQPSQPEVYRSLTWSLDTLLSWAQEIREIAEKALQDTPELHTGSQCHWCSAKTICKAFGEQAAAAAREIADLPRPDAEAMFGPGTPDPVPPPPVSPQANGGFLREVVEGLLSLNSNNPSPAEQSRILELVPILEQYLSTLRKKAEEEVTGRLAKGETVPGWKLVPGRRSRSWVEGDTKALAAALGRLGIPASEVWDKKIRSVGQVEKSVPDRSRERFSKMFIWTDGRPVLATDSDPRPPIRDAGTMFAPVSEEQPEVFSWL
jgi:RecB family exonuclease